LLYCCALRIFQLRALRKDSIIFSKDNKTAWVTVPAKCTKNQRFSETKEVHPDFLDTVRNIIDRRALAGDTALFPDWQQSANGSTTPVQVKLEAMVKELNVEAAKVFGWPSALSFHGTHNFRHGAAQDAFAIGGLDLVMARTGHISTNCAQHYARSDLERLHKHEFLKLVPNLQEKWRDDHIKKCKENAELAVKICSTTLLQASDIEQPDPEIIQQQTNRCVVEKLERMKDLVYYGCKGKEQNVADKKKGEIRVILPPDQIEEVPIYFAGIGYVSRHVPKAAKIPPLAHSSHASTLLNAWRINNPGIPTRRQRD